MYELKANFHPAAEAKNGYIGKADLLIANAVRLNNVSVFAKDDGYALSFTEYGENGSLVVPKGKEQYAAMRDVIAKAVESEKHFAFEKGSYGPKFNVRGRLVDEPYADGRFSVEVGDFCTLCGITTQKVEFEKDGKDRSFIAVNMPAVRDADGKVRMYQNSKGKDVASLEFQGVVSKWTDKAGQEQSLDYGVKIADAVKKARKELLAERDRKTSLDDQMKGADAQKANASQPAKNPNKQQEEPAL